MGRPAVYCGVVRPLPYFDVKEHLRTWRRHVLPLFTLVGALLMIVFVALRAGSRGAPLPGEGFVAAPVGLIPADADAVFDPAFAILSPTELALSPRAAVFGAPFGPLGPVAGGEVLAAADGRVTFAGSAEAGPTVLLTHQRERFPVETLYAGLGSIRVAVGAQVRRGQPLGNLPPEGARAFRFERRRFPALAIGEVPGEAGPVPEDWRSRPDDRMSPPPEGEPVEAATFQLETPVLPE